jgi:hypothetical protein
LLDTFGAQSRDNDPITTLRVMRRAVLGITLAGLLVALCLLAVGLITDDLRIWNLGLALLAGLPGGAVIVAGTLFAEMSLRGIRANSKRLDAIEAAERAIADTIQPDELERRRRES